MGTWDSGIDAAKEGEIADYLERVRKYLANAVPSDVLNRLSSFGATTISEAVIFSFFEKRLRKTANGEYLCDYSSLSDLWEKEISRDGNRISTGQRLGLQEMAKYFWREFWKRRK